MNNPFKGKTNEEVMKIVDSQNEFDPIMARLAIYQVFINNNTPRSVMADDLAYICYYSQETNGVGCAVALITPSGLKPRLKERIGIIELVEYDSTLNAYFAKANHDYLRILQVIHDQVLQHDRDEAIRVLRGTFTLEDFHDISDSTNLTYSELRQLMPDITELLYL